MLCPNGRGKILFKPGKCENYAEILLATVDLHHGNQSETGIVALELSGLLDYAVPMLDLKYHSGDSFFLCSKIKKQRETRAML